MDVNGGGQTMLLSAQQRAACTKAKLAVIGSRDDIQNAMNLAQRSGSQKRPALYQRALAAINQANELLEQARSANGR